MERTLVLVKPDGVQRGLVGEVISRLERRGLRMVAAKFMQAGRQLAEAHYSVHKNAEFYDSLIKHITSAPVLAMVWEGTNAVAAVRQMMGSTRPTAAAPGTLRHDFALDVGRNLTHASDSTATAESEIELWFRTDELIAWTRELDRWVFE